jgi:hypothetical protein
MQFYFIYSSFFNKNTFFRKILDKWFAPKRGWFRSLMEVQTRDKMGGKFMIPKNAKVEVDENLKINVGSKIIDRHAEIWDNKVWINPVAFDTWARLAFTIVHEAKHMEELRSGKWDGKTDISRYKSEKRAWEQSGSLGDKAAPRMISKYVRLINILEKN